MSVLYNPKIPKRNNETKILSGEIRHIIFILGRDKVKDTRMRLGTRKRVSDSMTRLLVSRTDTR